MSKITEETVNQILSSFKRKSTLKEKDAEEKINKVWSYIGELKAEIFSLEEKIRGLYNKLEWIDVKDRLPILGQLVLACDVKRPKTEPKIVYRDDDSPIFSWWWETLSGETWENIEDEFTHWMPLPKEPRND